MTPQTRADILGSLALLALLAAFLFLCLAM